MSEWTKDEYRIAYGDTLGFMDIEMLRKAFALRDAEIKRLKSALNKYSEDEILCAKDTEIKRLNELASCGCGDGFTAGDPGRCGNCSVQDRIEIDRLRNELAELNARLIRAEERLAVTTANADKLRAKIAEIKEELESHAWEISPAMAQANIDALNAQLAEAKDAWAVAISVPQMQVRVASISHAGWLMLRAALEVKP